ncbi:MAG: hypothetical protein AUJ71_00200, partial [Candidatus Omnitrophica bacterium CG1_02_49_16]
FQQVAVPFFFFVIFFYNIPFLSAQIPEENSCVACHKDYWDEVKGSIHGQQGILCNRCHGGDPTKSDKAAAKAEGTGYIGVPDKKQIVEKCGQCHADVETMNFYGVRTDQLARYKTSMHGKRLLLEGDEKVAACTDCHGYHDISNVADPNSSVYPANIPKTCGKCHGNRKLMDAYKLPSDIPDIYKKSVHGRALYEKKDISVAQCASCHGGHGALPPGVKGIGDTCGKCHINEKKNFLESVHAKLGKEKFSECISCHGNHGVQHPSPALYEEACVECHEPQSEEIKMGIALDQAIRGSDETRLLAESLVKQASIDGIFVEEEMALLEEIKTNTLAMAPLQHTLSVSKIAQLHKKVKSASENIRATIRQKRENLEGRKRALILIWIFILVMIGALWTKYKQLAHGKDKHE